MLIDEQTIQDLEFDTVSPLTNNLEASPTDIDLSILSEKFKFLPITLDSIKSSPSF